MTEKTIQEIDAFAKAHPELDIHFADGLLNITSALKGQPLVGMSNATGIILKQMLPTIEFD